MDGGDVDGGHARECQIVLDYWREAAVELLEHYCLLVPSGVHCFVEKRQKTTVTLGFFYIHII